MSCNHKEKLLTELLELSRRRGPGQADNFVRLPGLYRRWELEQVLETGIDYHLEEAGSAEDGTRLFALYRRDAGLPT